MIAWPAAVLGLIVAAVLLAERRPALQHFFRWLPVPLWCYALPLLAAELGWLPREPAPYRLLTDQLLPLALALLLLGADLPAVMRTGARALLAALVGAAGIVAGVALGALLLRDALPPDAWKGAGALAGTWTGGTMNLLALRTLLSMPDPLFAPLIVVDAVIAYGWMALLIAASGFQRPLNAWLRASAAPDAAERLSTVPGARAGSSRLRPLLLCGVGAMALALGSRLAARHLPTFLLVSSATGWTVLLVTTAALAFSLAPAVRRAGAHGTLLGYPLLYLVLAATGAQARLDALWSTPAWLALGVIVVLVHGALLLLMGRALRIPLGTLATASQANIGGVVSGPLVGAIYHRSLAPVGLLLAVAGNAAGTYLGLLAASLCRLIGR
ncbi:MAG: DUF819 family protein [Candidatus Omnitrophica bacterium]|nr:DUF819 family protein [Candidatus Omnitrophota bacterium]